MAANVSFADYMEIKSLSFGWAESYDTKNWDGLKKILGPSVSLDFRELRGALHEKLSHSEYIAIVSDKKLIGDPCIKTQHFLGESRWTSLSNDKVEVLYQIRAAHQRFTAEDMAKAVNKGTGYGFTQITVERISGVWKIVGVKPSLHWTEDDLFGTVNPDPNA